MKKIICGLLCLFILAGCSSSNGEEVKTAIKDATLGSTIALGSYEQDGDTSNGAETLEWIVIGETENSKVLLSSKVIDFMPYDSSQDSYSKYIAFENTTLNQWLTGDFYKNAFSKDEKQVIANTDLSLISANDIETLNDDYKVVGYTEYAKAQYLASSETASLDGDTAKWWLKNVNDPIKFTSYVNERGKFTKYTLSASYQQVYSGVRPVIEVKY